MNHPDDLRVTLVQGNTRWHDPSGNREYYGELIASLNGRTDLVVLPETFTSGFSNEALAEAETMKGPSVEWMLERAARIGAVITGSLQCRVDGTVFNRLIWAMPDGRALHYDKRHLFRMAGEHERYGAGRGIITPQIKGWHVRPLVCYDLRFPVFIRNRYNHQQLDGFDYDLLLFVANWPAPRRHAWRTLLAARAIENLAYCVGVNRCGVDGNEVPYAGDSMALDFLGMPLIDCGGQEQLVTVNLSAELLRTHRQRFPAQMDADRFELIDV